MSGIDRPTDLLHCEYLRIDDLCCCTLKTRHNILYTLNSHVRHYAMNHPGHHDAQPVSSLNLNPSLRAKLAKAGYRSVRDLKEASPVELSKGILAALRLDSIEEKNVFGFSLLYICNYYLLA